ncbi:mutS protein homolog 5-like [Tigriopus californicus]|uniref:mutS protein homolog 5-like n=1 Tax=Tigriopus californicus TaxID=6832 RepID=UPI0027DA2844|nr:mutS protein homolog 5-like [Tigriopus californicus]
MTSNPFPNIPDRISPNVSPSFLPNQPLGSSLHNLEFEDEDLDEDQLIVALHLGQGRLGGASYSSDSASLSVLSDVTEMGPEFQLTQSLMTQVRPVKVLVGARQNAEFLDRVREICGLEAHHQSNVYNLGERGDSVEDVLSTPGGDISSSIITAGLSTLITRDAALTNVELIYLNSKDFDYESCHRRVSAIEIHQFMQPNRDESAEQDRMLHLHNLIDFKSENAIRSAGALLKYLDLNLGPEVPKKRAKKHIEEPVPTFILSIRPLTIENILSLDETTFTALQIFNADSRASGSKAGSWNKKREGLSLFSVLNRCKSVLGSKYLRHMCRCPTRNLNLIQNRQEVISFLASPGQGELVKALQGCLTLVKNVPKLLKGLVSTQASVKTWKSLKKSLQGGLMLIEVCGQVRNPVNIFRKISDTPKQALYEIASFIDRILDMEMSEERQKFTVNSGIDEDLDDMRRLHNGLPDLLLQIAQKEIIDLPDFMTECTMIYAPQIGYLLAVQPWQDDLDEDDLWVQDLEFMFLANGVPHYKSRRCVELDEYFGDTATKISEKETSIMVQLIDFILKRTEDVLAITRYAAVLDCLMSLAIVAGELGWKRPQVMPPGTSDLKVANGRHPLQDICSSTFVPNHVFMDSKVRAMILTGPNACGKSVYLKQIGLIVYLAHMGSYVPADQAVIPLMDRIYSRIQTVESISLGLSSFMVDVNQMSLCLRSATPNSLILVDEFGKGTSETDGLALLAATLDHLATQNPFLLVTTHFQSIKSCLQDVSKFHFFTFDHKMDENDRLVYLYRLKPGLCSSSMACYVARDAGIEERIVRRSREIANCVAEGTPIKAAPLIYNFQLCESLAENFINLDLEDRSSVEAFFDDLQSNKLW